MSHTAQILIESNIATIRCWLPSEKGVIFAFVGPMVAIIVVSSMIVINRKTVVQHDFEC